MLAAGWSMILLGLVGLVLPFLQGVLFLAIGVGILSHHSPWARRQLHRLRRRYPRAAHTLDAARVRVSGWYQRRDRALGDG